MRDRICCDCVYRIENSEDAHFKLADKSCWKCRYNKWQDESICLSCTQNTHGCRQWAERCPGYAKGEALA
jgi:hypothetical protein